MIPCHQRTKNAQRENIGTRTPCIFAQYADSRNKWNTVHKNAPHQHNLQGTKFMISLNAMLPISAPTIPRTTLSTASIAYSRAVSFPKIFKCYPSKMLPKCAKFEPLFMWVKDVLVDPKFARLFKVVLVPLDHVIIAKPRPTNGAPSLCSPLRLPSYCPD